ALESEFGSLNLTGIPDRFDASTPVLVMGAREFATSRATALTQEETAVIEPAPLPETEIETDMEPEVDTDVYETVPAEPMEPAEDLEPALPEDEDMEEGETLPATATGLPLLALIGLASITLGFVARRR
ncbi:MAG: hypothetical protein HY646_03930, partial [Acidobacteria bacterium]|nr:hypothetical protein [Acidobacteriota bacterium]